MYNSLVSDSHGLSPSASIHSLVSFTVSLLSLIFNEERWREREAGALHPGVRKACAPHETWQSPERRRALPRIVHRLWEAQDDDPSRSWQDGQPSSVSLTQPPAVASPSLVGFGTRFSPGFRWGWGTSWIRLSRRSTGTASHGISSPTPGAVGWWKVCVVSCWSCAFVAAFCCEQAVGDFQVLRRKKTV